MSIGISVDWSEVSWCEDWENHGRSVISEACTHKSKESGNETLMRYQGYCDKCGFNESSGEPMMNFAYPLETTPSDEYILQILKRTNCTVVENLNSGAYFLALTGGGMDLSQDIALAYHIVEEWIPYELCESVCTQKDLSVSGKDFKILKKAVLESLCLYKTRCNEKIKKWREIK